LLGSAGIRVDYTPFQNFEYQPSVRLLFTPRARQSAWFAISRAVRLPNRTDRDLCYDNGQIMLNGFPVATPSFGSHDMRSEVERSAELGYRIQFAQRWSADGSLFWSDYSRLRTIQLPLEPVVTFVDNSAQLSLPGKSTNGGRGKAYGGEVWATWQVSP